MAFLYVEGPANDHLPIIVFISRSFICTFIVLVPPLTRFIFLISVIYGNIVLFILIFLYGIYMAYLYNSFIFQCTFIILSSIML